MRYRTLRFIGGGVYVDWVETSATRISLEDLRRFGSADPWYDPVESDYTRGYDAPPWTWQPIAPAETERDRLIAKVRRLAERGATAGERAAARAALERLGS